MDPVRLEQFQEVSLFGRNYGDSPGFRWHEQYTNPNGYHVYRYQGHEYSEGYPRAPFSGKYIMIQPRNVDTNFRDRRMLLPITKKRKGNNKYGQSGSHRCMRCQKGKRKCVYDSKDEPCQRCVERGFTDCGEKLPTPRKQAALRLLRESGYIPKETVGTPRSQSSEGSNSPQPPEESGRMPLLTDFGANLPTPTLPTDEALAKLWAYRNI